MAHPCFSASAADGTRTQLQAKTRVCCFLPRPHQHAHCCGPVVRKEPSHIQTRLHRGRSAGRVGSKAESCQAEMQASTSGRHCLDCGQELEVISFHTETGHPDKPPLLFLHGALHGAWCYAENFLPYFARRGYDAHAVSLRGHGASDFVPGAAGSFSEHIKDLGSVVQSLGRPPILIAHSLGGIFAQRYLAEMTRSRELPRLTGIAFVAAPGLAAMLSPSMQWLRQLEGVKHGLQIIWWMSAMPKSQQGLVQELFFSQDLPAEKFERYHQKIMEQRSILPVTGRELTDYKRVLDEALEGLRGQQEVPVLVSSAGSDRMLMRCQVEVLAEMLGTEVVAIPDVGHDLMLVCASPSEPQTPVWSNRFAAQATR